MKKYLLTLLLCLPLLSVAQSTEQVKKKVAVYVTGDDVRDSYKKVIGSQLVNAFANTNQYSAVERTAEFLSAIDKEFGHEIENVRDSQIAQIGQQLGVRYVVVADATDFGDQYYLDGRIINVETALIDKSYTVSGAAEDLNQLIALSKKLAEGLLGGSSKSANQGSSTKINGHEAVDLGLSVKWATCNVGASSPEQYGNYYAWGETYTKGYYSEDNCATYYKHLGDIAGSAYDVAHTNWGGTWRMPTETECRELINRCAWSWTSQGGHYGYKVTGPNGNSIFLPAAGYRSGDSANDVGSYGYYWSSTPYSNDSRAWELYFGDGDRRMRDTYRWYGQTIRPVSE